MAPLKKAREVMRPGDMRNGMAAIELKNVNRVVQHKRHVKNLSIDR